MEVGNDFYVTLPSNASLQIYPNNTKAAYVTSLNVPIILNGEYEVALTNITCSAKIEFDIGKIRILNVNEVLLEHVKVSETFKNEWQFDMTTEYHKLNETLEEIEKQICFYQLYMNSKILEKPSAIQRSYQDYESKNEMIVFYDLMTVGKLKDKSLFYIPYINNKLPSFIKTGFTMVTNKNTNSYIEIPKEKFLEQVPALTKIKLLPFCFELYSTFLTNSGFQLNPLYYWKSNEFNSSDLKFRDAYLNMKKTFESIFESLKNKLFREEYGLFNLQIQAHPKLSNEIKFSSSFEDLKLEANGICSNLFGNKIKLNNYYTISQNFNSVNYAVIYCDIIDAQIFGDSLSQILQIVPLNNSNKDSQLLINNLDSLQYVKVNSSFIDKISINIKDLIGNPIKFNSDNSFTVVKLHFRKTK